MDRKFDRLVDVLAQGWQGVRFSLDKWPWNDDQNRSIPWLVNLYSQLESQIWQKIPLKVLEWKSTYLKMINNWLKVANIKDKL